MFLFRTKYSWKSPNPNTWIYYVHVTCNSWLFLPCPLPVWLLRLIERVTLPYESHEDRTAQQAMWGCSTFWPPRGKRLETSCVPLRSSEREFVRDQVCLAMPRKPRVSTSTKRIATDLSKDQASLRCRTQPGHYGWGILFDKHVEMNS